MNWVDAVILGLVQGITEFLPVSSSGHLVLFSEWLTINGVNELAFTAILHLATTAAVMLYFRNDIWSLFQVALRKLGRLPVNERDVTLLYALIIGTIPAAVLGFFLESFIEDNFMTSGVVAILLFLTAILFMYTEWRYYISPAHGQITLKRGVLIGCYQALALLPGMSRSGATLAGGMLLGLSRYESARYSFLLAIPITLGVGIKKYLDLLQTSGDVYWNMLAVSAVISFITALIVIHFFLGFIRKYTLWPFVWYCIILAGMVGYVAVFT